MYGTCPLNLDTERKLSWEHNKFEERRKPVEAEINSTLVGCLGSKYKIFTFNNNSKKKKEFH